MQVHGTLSRKLRKDIKLQIVEVEADMASGLPGCAIVIWYLTKVQSW